MTLKIEPLNQIQRYFGFNKLKKWALPWKYIQGAKNGKDTLSGKLEMAYERDFLNGVSSF